MSDFQAIGGVSATLKAVLDDRMEIPADAASFQVTVGPPRSEQPQDGIGPEKARVNLFLYRVTENGTLKNQEIPGQGTPGAYGHPPLSLDLHYLVTAYGASVVDDDFVDETRAHLLLGSAMRVLHDFPVITDELGTVKPPPGRPVLHETLRGEFEKVKLTLDPLSLEDLSKVWTALTLPYRLSAAYRVSVVQIESRRSRRSPQLVGEPPDAGPRFAAVSFQRPRIEAVRVRRPGDAPDTERVPFARIGDTVIIRGRGFAGEGRRLTLGGVDVTAAITIGEDDLIEVVLPDDPALQPGALGVSLALEAPELDLPVFTSNPAAFVLIPSIDAVSTLSNPKRVKVTGKRLFSTKPQSVAILGTRVFLAPAFTKQTPTEIVFGPVADTPAGTHPVRVRVNGAESLDERAVTLP